MDGQAIRERLEKLTYRQLQQEAKKNGVKAKGTKEKLLKNVIKKLALEPFDSSFSSSAADTTAQTLDTTTQSTYPKADEGLLNEYSAENTMNKNGSPEQVNSAAIVAADTTTQVLDNADEESSSPPSVTTTSAAMNEKEISSSAADTTHGLDNANEESLSPPSFTTTSVAMNENVLPKQDISSSAADATTNGLDNVDEESLNPPSTTSAAMNENASPEKEISSSAADTTTHGLDDANEESSSPPSITTSAMNEKEVSSSAMNEKEVSSSAADTTYVLDNANEESSSPLSITTTSAAVNENASPEKEISFSAADATTHGLDNANEESLNPPSTTSAAMNENVSPKKGIFGGSPLKSPGVARQRFIGLHQRAAEQMTDIETDQKRKEERHSALTRCWTPNINKLSKPKFATPSKKVPESPYKRRRSTTIETGTPSKKRYCQGLTCPELTPRLEILAQPKTPPRPVSRTRASSVARMNYIPRKGAYHFVDTTGMSDEKFNEYKKQRTETGQS
jgi:hypothetical protein